MKISLLKENFLEKLNLVSHFTSSKLSSLSALQGVLIEIKKDKMHFYATNLNSYIHATLTLKTKEEVQFIIDPKKIIEFVTLLPSANMDLEIKENKLTISSGKIKGSFPLMNVTDFPPLPIIKEEKQPIDEDFFQANLPLVLFAASSDETRPVLTGINFISDENEIKIVATDGFRLSLMKIKKEMKIPFPSFIVPADFMDGLFRFVSKEAGVDRKKILFAYSKSEKVISFTIGDNVFYSRLIDGEFPQYEKVIPSEVNTEVKILKEDLLRNIKLASVFARDFSNIIVFDFKKDGLYIKPRVDNDQGDNSTFQEVEFKGKEEKIAFNFRFILDLLNHLEDKKIIIEVARPDAPAVFRSENNPDFIHLIMPVRIETS